MLIQLTDVRYYVNYSDRKRAAKKIPNDMSFSHLAKLVKMGVDFYDGDGSEKRPREERISYIVFGYKINDRDREYHGTDVFIPDVFDDDTPIPDQFDAWFCNLKREWQRRIHDDAMIEAGENDYNTEFGGKRKRKT